MVKIIYLSFLFFSSLSCASTLKKRVVAQTTEVPHWCRQVGYQDWNLLSPQKARSFFSTKSKIELNQYLWAEVLNEKPSVEVVLLINFLANHQSTENEHSYYTLVASAINLKVPIYEVMDNWEQNKNEIKLTKINTTLPTLCSSYEKATKE